jgi:hypothetical protein
VGSEVRGSRELVRKMFFLAKYPYKGALNAYGEVENKGVSILLLLRVPVPYFLLAKGYPI